MRRRSSPRAKVTPGDGDDDAPQDSPVLPARHRRGPRPLEGDRPKGRTIASERRRARPAHPACERLQDHSDPGGTQPRRLDRPRLDRSGSDVGHPRSALRGCRAGRRRTVANAGVVPILGPWRRLQLPGRSDIAYVLASDHNFRRSPKYRIGFANAALDSPWRTALVHAVEFGAARRRDLVGSLIVRHAARSVARQVTDLESLIEAGVDGLVVSALDVDAISPIVGRAAERGIPTVLVDRGRAGTGPHVSFVACDNWMIGWTMAQWLCEHIAGRGGIVMLSGDRSAEPAQRRSEGARSAFAQFREIRVLAQEWTDWQKARGFEAMRAASAEHGHDIAGVSCDSGFRRPDRSAPASRRDGGRTPAHGRRPQLDLQAGCEARRRPGGGQLPACDGVARGGDSARRSPRPVRPPASQRADRGRRDPKRCDAFRPA